MVALKNWFVSTPTRSGTLPLLVHLLTDFFDDFCHLTKYLVGIEVRVPLANPIDRGPGTFDPVLPVSLILFRVDDGRDRLAVLDQHHRTVKVLHRGDDVVEFGSCFVG